MKLYYWLRDWQLPGQQDKGASKVDVPSDAAGLCAWLNERRVPICLSLADPDKSAEQAYGERRLYDPEPELTTAHTGPLVPAVTRDTQRQWDGESIVEFVLDRATVAQTEAILSALGARFGELAKAVRS